MWLNNCLLRVNCYCYRWTISSPRDAQRSALGGEQSRLHRSTVIPEMQRMPVTTATWPLDDTGPQVQPTPGLPTQSWPLGPLRSVTQSALSQTQLCPGLFCCSFGGSEQQQKFPRVQKQGAHPPYLLRQLPISRCSGQSPRGSDRTLQARNSPVRLSDVPRSPGESQPESESQSQSSLALLDFRAAYQEQCRLAL